MLIWLGGLGGVISSRGGVWAETLAANCFLWILGLMQVFSDDILQWSMDLYDRAAHKFEAGLVQYEHDKYFYS